jgi:transposase-like protein
MSSSRKPRKHYTPAEKVALLRRHLIEKVPVSDLCEEQQLNVNVFYLWQRQFFEQGAAAFERRGKSRRSEDAKDRRIVQLEAKLAQKHEVISELMEENVRAKKSIGEL